MDFKIENKKIDYGFETRNEEFYFVSLKGQYSFIIEENETAVLFLEKAYNLSPNDGFNNMIDICKDLNIPVILVVGNKLGAINHALLSIEVLRLKNLDLKGLIFNNICQETPLEILDDNILLSEASKIGTVKFDINIFKRGIYADLDNFEKEYEESKDELECLRLYLERFKGQARIFNFPR